MFDLPPPVDWTKPRVCLVEKNPKGSKGAVSFEFESLGPRSLIRAARAKWRDLPEVNKQPEALPVSAAPTSEALRAADLLKMWREEDSEESAKTWEYLETELDKDRLSDRKFFD